MVDQIGNLRGPIVRIDRHAADAKAVEGERVQDMLGAVLQQRRVPVPVAVVDHDGDRHMVETIQALDAHLSNTSNRVNQVMKVLTVLTTIFMPLTVLTGMWGMNIELPDFPGGVDAQFWWIAGIMGAQVPFSAIVPLKRYGVCRTTPMCLVSERRLMSRSRCMTSLVPLPK